MTGLRSWSGYKGIRVEYQALKGEYRGIKWFEQCLRVAYHAFKG